MSRRGRTLLLSEGALWLVTVTAVVGMHRLFEDGSYRPALVLQATAAHLVVALLRRRGVGLGLAAAATAAAGVLMLTWVHYLGTTIWLLPTGETLGAAGDDLRAAYTLFQDVKAPAPVETGFLLTGGAALWVIVFIADWAALRAGATFEALLPSATLFLFAAALGAPGGRVPGTMLYTACALLFVLVQRTLNQELTAAWAATHRNRGRWPLFGTGTSLVALTVIAGAVAGPNLPGADAPGVIDWRHIDDEEDTRVVLSPMVDLQTRLVDQPDVEVFTVRTDQPQYWRLTALDEFDGRIWGSSYETNDAEGSLPQEFESTVPSETVRQEFAIISLAAAWLPAAYQPVAIDPGDSEVDWDAESSTLIVDRSLDTSDGFEYAVESEVPNWTAEQMRTATGEVPDDIAERYLQLPDLDPQVETLARSITEQAPTPYDKALALMNYLRGPRFTYDLNAPRGHGTDALMAFLFETRRGYCEQFAGAYAVLARSIGLPSRVVIGFTPGVPDAEDPSLWHVLGRNAHAWVEVYLGELGWVIVEATPGRAPPEAERWLGPISGSTDSETPPPLGGQGSGEEAAPSPRPGAATPSGDEQRTGVVPDRDRGGASSRAGDQGGEMSDSMRTTLLVVGIAILAYLVLVPAGVAAQRGLRRRAAQTPADQVRLAWREATDRARAAGVALPASLTISEMAERLGATVPGAATPLRHLAAAMEHVTYAEVEPSPGQAEQALAARDAVVDEIRQRQPLAARVLRYFDVRLLWRGQDHPGRRQAHSGPTPALNH